jgi:predicted PurR-regulated permease PerM
MWIRTLFFSLGFMTLLVASLSLAQPYLVPIAVAILVWFLINAMASGLQYRIYPVPDWVATLVSVAVLFALILFVAQVILANVTALATGIEGIDATLIAAVNRLLENLGLPQRVDRDGLWAGIDIESALRTGFAALRSLASDVSLVFLYVLFLILDQRYYEMKLRALVPDPVRRATLEATLRHVADTTRTYLYLMTLISAGVGLATWTICAIIGVPGPGFWGFLAFGLNFIPTIGSILGVAMPAMYGLLVLESDVAVVVLVALLAGVQFMAGEIVLPRVMGKSLNLSSFVIMLSLVVWGAMWGPAGLFLGIPIMVILTILFSEFERTRFIAIALSRDGTLSWNNDPAGRTIVRGGEA